MIDFAHGWHADSDRLTISDNLLDQAAVTATKSDGSTMDYYIGFGDSRKWTLKLGHSSVHPSNPGAKPGPWPSAPGSARTP